MRAYSMILGKRLAAEVDECDRSHCDIAEVFRGRSLVRLPAIEAAA